MMMTDEEIIAVLQKAGIGWDDPNGEHLPKIAFYNDDDCGEQIKVARAIEAHLMQGPVIDNHFNKVFTGLQSEAMPYAVPRRQVLPLFTAPLVHPDEWIKYGATKMKIDYLQERGFQQVGVVMCDEKGKRAIVDMGKVTWPAQADLESLQAEFNIWRESAIIAQSKLNAYAVSQSGQSALSEFKDSPKKDNNEDQIMKVEI